MTYEYLIFTLANCPEDAEKRLLLIRSGIFKEEAGSRSVLSCVPQQQERLVLECVDKQEVFFLILTVL